VVPAQRASAGVRKLAAGVSGHAVRRMGARVFRGTGRGFAERRPGGRPRDPKIASGGMTPSTRYWSFFVCVAQLLAIMGRSVMIPFSQGRLDDLG